MDKFSSHRHVWTVITSGELWLLIIVVVECYILFGFIFGLIFFALNSFMVTVSVIQFI